MKKTSPDSEKQPDRIRSWAHTKAHGRSTDPVDSPNHPLGATNTGLSNVSDIPPFPSTNIHGLRRESSKSSQPLHKAADNTTAGNPPPAPPPQADGQGDIVTPVEAKKKKNVATRFWLTTKSIVLSSWINVLLIFVPVGIAAEAAGLSPGIIFGMNAIAIIPLAGLLSHATESVAKRMGDTIGALMNVTFGNAVELIIFMYVTSLERSRQERARSPLKGIIKSIASHIIKFISFVSHVRGSYVIALAKNEIRIVQASLLGSILANLLLILGMCFLVGGLRFREQIYNSTVTQMSACLLSLAVMSLLLPTAFHASFNTENAVQASDRVLKVSRGTSVILLLVYAMYLIFQLKSHAYMYESTPQHIIDEELAPGPVAAWMESSDSSSDSSSSSDSDGSSGSNNTAKRFKRVMRGGRKRRKSSAGSKEIELPTRTPSIGTSSISPVHTEAQTQEGQSVEMGHRFGAIDMAAEDADNEKPRRRSRKNSISSHLSKRALKKERKRQEKRERRAARHDAAAIQEGVVSNGTVEEKVPEGPNDPRRVDFAVVNDLEAQTTIDPTTKRSRFGSMRPQIPKTFSQNVFTTASPAAPAQVGPVPRVRYGIRRTNSLPDRLNQTPVGPARTLTSAQAVPPPVTQTEEEDDDDNISRTTAVVLLLVSTGLVALCAEFMVDSIDAVVSGNSGLSEAFVGLIILPIVGNAAEHVTAVTVASKNKMDLAIGVAVGSSIQIALFVTPFVVLLGWCMNKEMTLYFTLFETVSLFVSAFIVNFLVLDGRSNYLEGALLIAAYIIIAVAAFFYPAIDDSSNLGGNPDAAKMIRDVVGGVIGI